MRGKERKDVTDNNTRSRGKNAGEKKKREAKKLIIRKEEFKRSKE